LLVVADDVHWLDGSSAEVLAFLARRLESEPIVVVAATRAESGDVFDSRGIEVLSLGPLQAEAAGELLAVSAPELAPPLRERILLEAAGNPLALVELPIGLAGDGPTVALREWLPLTTRLENSFIARFADLPAACRAVLLVASLNDGDSLAEALEGASLALSERVSSHEIVPASLARLVTVHEQRIVFRHPLMRTAIRQASTPDERQSAHAALAAVLVTDADRSVWHRAAACVAKDDGIAAELEATASRARQHGALDVAVAALTRSAELTESDSQRGARLLSAAELATQMGKRETVLGLLALAEPLELTRRQRWWMLWIRESFDDGTKDLQAGARELAAHADEAAIDGETDLALNLLWGAALRCFWAEPGEAVRRDVVAVADRMPVPATDPRVLAILAYASPLDRAEAVTSGLRSHAGGELTEPRASYLLGTAATLVGAANLAAAFGTASLIGLRAQGRLGVLARALAVQAWNSVQVGDLEVAVPAAAEAARLAKETGQPIMVATALSTSAVCAALLGDHRSLVAFAAEAERASLVVGARPVLATVQHARGLDALGGGRYAEAFGHLRRMHDPDDPAFHISIRCFAIGDLVEAAVRAGQQKDISSIVAEMERIAESTPSPALLVGLGYARALLSDEEGPFVAALADTGTAWPFARARILLAYGGWLRRRRRAADARDPLRRSRDMFDALGTAPWSERARQELRASGETTHERVPEAHEQLTPQELQIARLAAEGLTNRDIGERLYLSHRTVSSHLHTVFPKLGITSRTELGAVLRGEYRHMT
jgi:DNA-binding CsgD family transcriptional regulator